MRNSFIALLGVIAFSLTNAPNVFGQVTIYNSQSTFLANVQPGSYTETYNSFPLGTVPSPIAFAQGPFAYNAAATAAGGGPSSFFMVGTASDVWLSPNVNTDVITYNFTSGNISAVGGFFFPTDVSGNVIPGDVTVTVNGAPPQTLTNATPTTFLGFTSPTPFTTLTFTASQAGGVFRFPTGNDFIVGTSIVPEPTSLALLGIPAIGGVIWRRRRTTAAV